jgi:hypothetical protein
MTDVSIPVVRFNTKEAIALLSLAEVYLRKFPEAMDEPAHMALVSAKTKLNDLLFADREVKVSA